MRAYFGWEKTSRMASHYVHLAQAHMDQRIREEAKLDPFGTRLRDDPKQALADAIVTTIEMLLQRGLLQGTGQTSRESPASGTARLEQLSTAASRGSRGSAPSR